MPQKKAKAPRSGDSDVVLDSAVLVDPQPKKRIAKKKTVAKPRVSIALPTNTLTSTPKVVRSRAVRPKVKKEPVVQIVVASTENAPAIVPIVRGRLQLALLSPFRLPIDNHALVAQVARLSGVAFVVIGAFFTLLNMPFAGNSFLAGSFTNQHASLTDSYPTYDCSSPTSPNYNQEYCATNGTGGSIDTTPDVQLNIESTEPFSNTVPVNLNVPLATRVVVYARHTEANDNIILGDARKLDNLHWRLYWDTPQFHDGTYRITAVVTNAYGTYDQSFSTDYSVLNNPTEEVPNTSGSSSSTTTATTSGSGSQSTTTPSTNTGTTSASLPQPSVTLTVAENAPLSGDVALRVIAAGAHTVSLFSRPKVSTTFKKIGTAMVVSDGSWKFVWDTETVPNGEYVLKAVAEFTTATVEGVVVSTSILNDEQIVASSLPATTTTPVQTELEPDVALRIPEGATLTDDADVVITVRGVRYVEVYALPKNSLTPRFLGLAQKKSETEWMYRWYTKQTPNGEYKVFARIGHSFGTSESARIDVRVSNEIVLDYTPEQQTRVDEVEDITSQLETVTEKEPVTDATTTIPILTIAPKATYVQPVSDLVESIESEDDARAVLATSLTQFRVALDAELGAYARALRTGDDTLRDETLQRIEVLKKELIESVSSTDSRADVIEKINTYLATMITALTELTARNESVIKERIGDRASLDTDKDGITDYDELNLYATNPFAADSDGDSFIDGTEIMQGFDPNDARAETLVMYESPRENGIVREDVFSIETITTLAIDEDELITDGVTASALISGRGLPNSFVSLFIFSTPIVVTVKTDEEGAWSYIFDKELENGEHEIYAGVTDNAGRVVAKSNPLVFVKTAEAYTPVNTAEAASVTVDTATPRLITDQMLLAIASIAIVGLGLVLMLLGLHTRRHTDEQILRYP